MGVWLDSNGCTLGAIPFIDTCIKIFFSLIAMEFN
mgnify:CR=1 FL=1